MRCVDIDADLIITIAIIELIIHFNINWKISGKI